MKTIRLPEYLYLVSCYVLFHVHVCTFVYVSWMDILLHIHQSASTWKKMMKLMLSFCKAAMFFSRSGCAPVRLSSLGIFMRMSEKLRESWLLLIVLLCCWFGWWWAKNLSDIVATTVLIVPRQRLMRAVYSKRVISNLKKTCRRCVSVYTNVSKEEKKIKRENVKKEVKKKVVHITLAPVPAPKPKPAPTPARKFNYGRRNQVETIENLICDFSVAFVSA